MSGRIFACIVLILIALIVAINMISSTYNIFSLIVSITKLIGIIFIDIRSSMG